MSKMGDRRLSFKGDYTWRGIRKNGGITSMSLQLGREKPINYSHKSEINIIYKPSRDPRTCIIYASGGNETKHISGRIYNTEFPVSDIID
jgi:hypothetical protein